MVRARRDWQCRAPLDLRRSARAAYLLLHSAGGMVPACRLPALLLRSRRVDRHGTDEPSVGDAAARLRDAQLPRRARVEDAAVVSQPLPGLPARPQVHDTRPVRSEEHTSELQSLMRISYAVFCL